MLFFRSEELIRKWCRTRAVEPRPIVRMHQLWQLAVTWYGNRLAPVSRRPAANEMREIFARLGLHDAFWDPQADTFQ